VAGIFLNFGYVWVFVYIAGAWVATAVVTLAFGAKTTGQRLEAINPIVAGLQGDALTGARFKTSDH